MTARLLVVAGEASGDRAGAAVVTALRQTLSLEAVGMGGSALENAGVRLVADLRSLTALGLGAVTARAGRILLAGARLVQEARRERVSAALLVNYSEFNARLAPFLHRQGIYVLWYGAPQIWAWRPGRARELRRHVDRIAVMLPFEEALWRGHGVPALYVGHPAREVVAQDPTEARERLGLTRLAKTIAILPGSRAHEVKALLHPMLEAVERVRRDRATLDSRVLLAPSLDPATRDWARDEATRYRVPTYDVRAALGAGEVLPAFDVAVTASGTASLEAVLGRAVPVVAYRVGFLTEAVAHVFVHTPHYALPNVLLGRATFPELLQRAVNPEALANAIAQTLDRRAELLLACDDVLTVLGDKKTPSLEVAAMLRPWLVPLATPRVPYASLR